MRRCFLKGKLGDAINVLLSACGQNLRKLLRWLYFGPKKYRVLAGYLIELLERREINAQKLNPACA
jgi:hypothetical protein